MSPLVKSLVADNEPPAVQYRGRTTLMHRIESRFRFLAVRFHRLLVFLKVEAIFAACGRQKLLSFLNDSTVL